jgi:SAM-dependent methyltransferase
VLYGAEYYHSHCGEVPYTADSAHWQEFYGRVADEVIRSFAPKRVFDAGCAIGFLVAALWDRNVEAYGRDISEFAISQVRPDVREFCSVGSIAEPIDGDFDLVLCIEVLEHMPEAEALEAIAMMTRAAPRILFSSTPSDFKEPTHVNVRPTRYWLRHFAAAGFAPVVEYDATYVCPHAILLERSDEGRTERDLTAFAEIVRQRLARAAEADKTVEIAEKLSDVQAVLASEQSARMAAEADWRSLLDASEAGWRSRLDAAERRSQALEARASVLPLRVRLLARRASRVAWWTLTLQLRRRLRERREWLSAHADAVDGSAVTVQRSAAILADARDAIARRFVSNDALHTYAVPATERRVSIVTDSIGESSLYDDVGTALIIATLLAERIDARLRLITRTEPADVQRLKVALEAQGLAWQGEIEAVHAPPLTADKSIPVGGRDVFLTTSWWTTSATLHSVPQQQIMYLLQDDERMLYPRGDDRLRCSETLARSDLHLLINSELLFRHLSEGADQLVGLDDRAHWFEPAFPDSLFYDNPDRERADGKRNLLFYARPDNPRNLFWRGVEAISLAIEEGILDPQRWAFTFVGKEIERVSLPGGVVPEFLENLPWDRYADVVRGVDLGLALMATPYASHPPLDLAASGAVVVTNTCGVKQSLDMYSQNIITTPPGVEDICRGLAAGVALALDESKRRLNYSEAQIPRDWRNTLETTIQKCATWIEG